MSDDGHAFLELSASFLENEFLPRIRSAVERLDPDDLWWRPNDASNSVGNLVLHLAGNLRQWVVTGIGGAPDVRRRDAEFDRRDPMSREELLGGLQDAVREAARVLRGADPADLRRERVVQGMTVTGMHAVYHAVEHFSMHTGQILWIVKLRTGGDLGFYRVQDGVAERLW
jgi:uncharacterized damage-inducible protein DinB